MTKYLLIESRDPYDSADSATFLDLAKGIREHGNDVTLFLLQNGALAARSGAELGATYTNLARAGVEVLADSFALRERAIDAHIKNIRRKIEVKASEPRYILTVYGVGYKFTDRS